MWTVRVKIRRQSAFLWLYALAFAGGSIAYVPFLTILLPIRVAAMTGTQRVHWLAYITFFGAIAASAGGILFGWLSDLSGVRRPWIACGLLSALALMMCVPLAREPQALLFLLIAWQLALNMMLGPLSAWAADRVPDSQLGALGGLLSLAPAIGAASAALVTTPGLAGDDGRLAIVALLVALAVIPVLVLGSPPVQGAVADNQHSERLPISHRRSVAGAMWLARLLVQISEATLFAYLYYYFRSIDPSRDAHWIARLFGIVLCAAVPLDFVIGRWSDRHGRPIFPLVCAAIVLGVALISMALAVNLAQASAGYILFALAATTFLSLHSAQTFRVLSRPHRRGRDLGVFNLTNTVPSLIMPWLTVAFVPTFGFSLLFLLLAAFAFAAATLLIIVVPRGSRLLAI